MTEVEMPRWPAFMHWTIPADDVEIQEWQDGRCAMCDSSRGNLVLDHCHDTGMTRGWLCRSCNGIEACGDSPAWLAWRAGCNPARLLGCAYLYISPITGRPVLRRPPLSGEDLVRACAAAEAVSHLVA